VKRLKCEGVRDGGRLHNAMGCWSVVAIKQSMLGLSLWRMKNENKEEDEYELRGTANAGPCIERLGQDDA